MSLLRNLFSIAIIATLSSFFVGCGGDTSQLNEASLDSANLSRLSILKANTVDIISNKVECQNSNEGELDVCVHICHRPPGNANASRTLALPLRAIAAHLHHGDSHHQHEAFDYLGECHSEDSASDTDSGCEAITGNEKLHSRRPHSDDVSEDNSSEDSDSGDHNSDSQSDDHQLATSTCPVDPTDSDPQNPESTDPTTDTTAGGSTGTATPGSETTPTDGGTGTTNSGGTTSTTNPGSEVPLWCQQNIARDANCDGIDDVTGAPIY